MDAMLLMEEVKTRVWGRANEEDRNQCCRWFVCSFNFYRHDRSSLPAKKPPSHPHVSQAPYRVHLRSFVVCAPKGAERTRPAHCRSMPCGPGS